MSHRIVHCSYHKCLTVYFHRIMHHIYNESEAGGGYLHFNSDLDRFYSDSAQYKVASINNHVLDLDKLGDCRVTRFIRDPRDLLVSGYLYHRRGAPVDDTVKKHEKSWCNRPGVTTADWKNINGVVPRGMGGLSYSQYLNQLGEEDGLLAELEFRQRHFHSMSEWPVDDERVLVLRYEDILGRELDAFRRMVDFYELPEEERSSALKLASEYSAANQSSRLEHIRNPASGQWKQYFTPRVEKIFSAQYGRVLEQYGYSTEAAV